MCKTQAASREKSRTLAHRKLWAKKKALPMRTADAVQKMLAVLAFYVRREKRPGESEEGKRLAHD